MTQRCGSCRFWDEATTRSTKRNGYCNVTFQPQAASMLEATPLRTGPDFGCVLWEAKEAKDERC